MPDIIMWTTVKVGLEGGHGGVRLQVLPTYDDMTSFQQSFEPLL